MACLEEVESFTLDCAQAFRVAASPVGFVALHADDTIRVWGADGGKAVATLETERAECVAVGPSGDIIVGCSDGTVRVWRDNALLLTCKGHEEYATAVAVSLMDGTFVSGSCEHVAKVWDGSTGACVAALEGHTSGVHAVCVLDSGDVVTASGNSFRVWARGFWTCTAVHEVLSEVCALMAMPLGGLAIAGKSSSGDDGFLAAWRGGVQLWALETEGKPWELAVVNDVFVACTPWRCMMVMGGTVIAKLDCSIPYAKPVVLRGGRVAVVAGGTCRVFRVVSRIGAIRILVAAWEAHGGAPPPPADGDARVAAISRTLSLRRICRPRGETEVGRATELVEPFGQAAVAFL